MTPRPVLACLIFLPTCLATTTHLDTISSSSTSSSSTSDTPTSSSRSTSTAESSTNDPSTSTDSSESSAPPPCDDDPACGPLEDVLSCPHQCNVCGDSVVVAPEACDNGTNLDPLYSHTPPPADACAHNCLPVQFCGDSFQNGPEPCDSAAVQTSTCEADCRLPSCGDGTLNLLAGELCDDNNSLPGDGCSDSCLPERRVFASSALYYGDLNKELDNPDGLTGLTLADARCNALALAAGLPPSFKAWLSDTNSSPSTRFDTSFPGLYRLLSPDFPILATGWSDLTDGQLAHPINADETGTLILGNAFTNTTHEGTPASDQHCSAWAQNDNSKTTIGQSSATDTTWTNLDQGLCSDDRRIYCFEDP